MSKTIGRLVLKNVHQVGQISAVKLFSKEKLETHFYFFTYKSKSPQNLSPHPSPLNLRLFQCSSPWVSFNRALQQHATLR